MKLGFEIVKYLAGSEGTLYTVRFQGRRQSEYDAFLDDPICSGDIGFGPLNARLLGMIRQEGIEPRMFQTRHYEAPLGRLFNMPKTGLRLYCWFDERIVIAGGGGVKLTPDLRNTPATKKAYEDLVYVSRRLRARLASGDGLRITHDGFNGNLKFEKVP